MSENTQLMPVRRESATDAYGMIMSAVADKACDPAKLRELLAVRREWNADEASKAFNAAVVEFQQRCPVVDKGDSANGRAYARIDRIWRAVRPLLRECGLAVTWESMQSRGDTVILDGHLRHSQGHAQPLHHEIPMPSAIPGQNAAQRAGSGETYAKRYATCAALGIQTGDDDDGACGGDAVSPDQSEWLREAIAYTSTDPAKVLAFGGCRSLDAFPLARFAEAQAMLRKKGAK